MTRVALLVTHLAGSGHLVRMRALAAALAERGAEVLLISGGRPLPHLEALPGVAEHRLMPLAVRDLDYRTLRHPDGRAASEAELAARRGDVAARLGGFAPDVLVTETYPLGRRRLAAEFEAAIAAVRAARPGALVAGSVRDVPEPPRPETRAARLAEAAARLAEYGLLLVHGEAEAVPLSKTWPLPEPVAGRVRYTGYVGPPDAPELPRGETVLVSVGGGALGRGLLALAAEAAALSARPWHLLVGGGDAAAEAARLEAEGRRRGARLVAEPARGDYPALLAGAAASVSLAGYNTAMDLAACRTPAVLVPMAEGGEREQTIRAAALAGLPGIEVVAAAGLGAAGLAAAAERAARAPRRPPWPWPRDGAARAAQALLEAAP